MLVTASISDEVIVVGPTLTNPFVSFSTGVISTWNPPPASHPRVSFEIGDVWIDPFVAKVLGFLHTL